MSRAFKLLIFSLFLIINVSCDKDDSPSIDPSTSYDVIVKNERGVTIQIFLRNESSQSNFENLGTIINGQEVTMENLQTGIEYTLRASEQGSNQNLFFYENTFSSDGTGTRRINIQ